MYKRRSDANPTDVILLVFFPRCIIREGRDSGFVVSCDVPDELIMNSVICRIMEFTKDIDDNPSFRNPSRYKRYNFIWHECNSQLEGICKLLYIGFAHILA